MSVASEVASPAVPAAGEELSRTHVSVLLASIFVVALCGIAYELIIGTVSSYLVGDSVWQFSITIGLFMFAMGVGAFLSQRIERELLRAFVVVEIALAAVGGISSILLFLMFPFPALYRPAMYMLILAIGTLVGLEIPLLTRVLSARDDLKESIANVLGFDYVGALIGSLAFPLVLLPHMGLFRASFGIGLLNVAVALVNVVAFRKLLRGHRALFAASVGVLVGLMALTLWATAISRYAEGLMYQDRIVWQKHSQFQRLVVTEQESNGRIRLYLNGNIQFAERDEYRYHEALTHPVMAIPGPRARVLVLGGGDGMAVREVLKYPDVERIDLVDIDPAVTEVSRTFPPIAALNQGALDDPKVHLHHVDAFHYIRTAEGQTWDRVIIDLPDPNNEALSKLYSVEFYRLMKARLSPDAFVVSQSSSPFYTREVFWTIGATLEGAGLHALAYHIAIPSFGMWGFQLAGVSRAPPKDYAFDVPLRFLTPEVMRAAQVFGKDVERPGVHANNMFEPHLYTLYLSGVRNN